MEVYQDLVRRVLTSGTYKPNRTAVDTVASFSESYEIDLQEGFPLLTTKQLDGSRWESLVHELLWYLSGEEHIRNLREHTGIWDAWADEEGRLDTAYGRFWRRFPLPADALPGETWTDPDHRWVNEEGTFDQIKYVLDGLREDPHSRRHVVTAWHPANASVSTLPPCHYTWVVSVQGGALNLHLTQRSGDVAIGIPFNIAAYAILARILAQAAGFAVGSFGHTIVDAHIYCGRGERGAWYAEHLDELQARLRAVTDRAEYRDVREWLVDANPHTDDGHDHLPNLLEQLTREPLERSELAVADVPIDELTFEDIELKNYQSHGPLTFAVAE